LLDALAFNGVPSSKEAIVTTALQCKANHHASSLCGRWLVGWLGSRALNMRCEDAKTVVWIAVIHRLASRR